MKQREFGGHETILAELKAPIINDAEWNEEILKFYVKIFCINALMVHGSEPKKKSVTIFDVCDCSNQQIWIFQQNDDILLIVLE